MFRNKFLLLLVVIVSTHHIGYSQQSDFCNAITTIIKDAPNKFRNIRGRELQSDMNAVIWDCGIKVPGTIASRFVVSMGLFYEGGVFQSTDLADLRPVYNKYKDMLTACLQPQGYKLSSSDNFFPGMADYKKLVFMKEPDENFIATNAPAHIAMEATYNKEAKHYTVVVFIFEH